MSRDGFKSLLVWQKAQDLAVTIYRVTQEGPLSRDFSLRDQMRRAASAFRATSPRAMNAIPTRLPSAFCSSPRAPSPSCVPNWTSQSKSALWMRRPAPPSKPKPKKSPKCSVAS